MLNAFKFAANVVLLFACFLLLSNPTGAFGCPIVPQVIEVVDEVAADESGDQEASDEDGDDDDDWVEVQDNPWGVDERKMKAAKLFWLKKAFEIEIQKIKLVCELDKKQALKLKIASKGAAKKELEVWHETWTKQMKQFQGMNFGGVGEGKKKKRNQEELVIDDADQIDEMTMQFMDNSNMMFGQFEEDRKAVDSRFWIKTVQGVLTAEQNEKYGAYVQQRKDAHVAAKIDAFIARMQMDLALTDEQVTKYDALVRPSMEKAPLLSGYYEAFAFQYFATKYDEAKMRSLLNEDQFQMMKMILGPSKTYGAMFDQGGGENVVLVGMEFDFGGLVLEAVGDALAGFVDGVSGFMGKLLETAGEPK